MKLKELIERYDWKNYIIYFCIYASVAIFVIWSLLSYIDILAHNTVGDGTFEYSKYNLIINLFNFFNKIFN